MASRKIPAIIVGGASFGTGTAFSTPETAAAALSLFSQHSCTEIDTAARYPPGGPGSSEALLGPLSKVHGFKISTKIMVNPGAAGGALSRENVLSSVKSSLERLKLEKVDILYAHMADRVTPMDEQAAAFDDVYKMGLFERFGISNWTLEEVKQLVKVCEDNGFVKPTVYQGLYNAVSRHREVEMIPALREMGIAFYAYSPAAGGFFTGAMTKNEGLEGTRFQKGNPFGDFQRAWYDKPEIHEAYGIIGKAVNEAGINGVEAALRWILFHSILGNKDGIIMGASRIEQMEQNMKCIEKGPLPKEVADAFEKAWEVIRELQGEK
ncbi:aldehyde reductase [Pyronema omphalodes]|nr:aldehyde reductase [Pyronema omphalodes]